MAGIFDALAWWGREISSGSWEWTVFNWQSNADASSVATRLVDIDRFKPDRWYTPPVGLTHTHTRSCRLNPSILSTVFGLNVQVHAVGSICRVWNAFKGLTFLHLLSIHGQQFTDSLNSGYPVSINSMQQQTASGVRLRCSFVASNFRSPFVDTHTHFN